MKKWVSISLLMLSAISSISQAADPDWAQVTSSQQKYQLFLNTKIFQREGDVVNATLRYAFGEPQIFPFLNVKYDRMERRFAFQCGERKMVPLESSYFLSGTKVHSVNLTGGNPFQSQEQALVPQKVSPQTLEDEALTQACNFKPSKE
ncbi:MAG: hypothetical protein KGZ83_02005 [Sulfuricella sp.]|nr:hypothetical protein [Sulfuricella sp.]